MNNRLLKCLIGLLLFFVGVPVGSAAPGLDSEGLVMNASKKSPKTCLLWSNGGVGGGGDGMGRWCVIWAY